MIVKSFFDRKNLISRLVVYALMLAGGTVAGTLLLLLVYLLPTGRMRDNLKYSMIAISDDADSTGEVLFGDRSTFAGAFTNELMLLEAVSDSDHGLFVRAMGAYRPVYGDDLWYPAQALIAVLGGDEDYPAAEEDYARYWHGYLVFLKPMLLIMSFEEIKLFNTMVLSVLFILVLLSLIKKGYKYGAAGFVMMWMLMMPTAIALGLQLTPCAYIMLITLLVLLKPDIKSATFVMFGCGMAVSYFDFLTFPLITLSVPLALILSEGEHDTKSMITECIRNSAAWGAGYVLFWGLKWVMGSIALGKNLFADAFDTVSKRTSAGDTSRIALFGQALYKNLYCWKALPYIILILALVIFWAVKMIRSRHFSAGDFLILLISAVLPLFWIFFAVNHSFEHATYTYRILAPPVFAAYLILDKKLRKSLSEKLNSAVKLNSTVETKFR